VLNVRKTIASPAKFVASDAYVRVIKSLNAIKRNPRYDMDLVKLLLLTADAGRWKEKNRNSWVVDEKYVVEIVGSVLEVWKCWRIPIKF
jgi:hypothetical protein